MIKNFYGTLLFLAIFSFSCGNKNQSSNNADNANGVKGNSPGSNLIEMDTMRMDTAAQNMSTDSTQH